MSPKKATQKATEGVTSKATHQSAKRDPSISKETQGLTHEERAAMKERAQELRAEACRSTRTNQADGERDVLPKTAEMQEAEHDGRAAPRFHQSQDASPDAENLVRAVRICQGRHGPLLLSERRSSNWNLTASAPHSSIGNLRCA